MARVWPQMNNQRGVVGKAIDWARNVVCPETSAAGAVQRNLSSATPV